MPIDAFAPPIPSVSGDTAWEGDSGAAARSNHRHARTTDSASTLTPFKDTFTMSGTTGTWTLTHQPLANPTAYSLHVYAGSAVLIEGTDYTISGQTVSVLAAAGLVSGDVLVGRYFYTASTDPTFAALIASLSPLAWWRLGDVSNGGSMADSSGNSHNGAWNASSTHTATTGLITGDSNQALNMTGASTEGAQVNYGSWMNVTNATWLMFLNTGDTFCRLIAREEATNVWSIQLAGGQVRVATSGVVRGDGPTAVNTGVKRMVAVTYDGTNFRIYAGATLDTTFAWAGPLATPTDSKITLGFGGGTGANQMFAGVMDEAIIWNRALSQGELAAILAVS